MPLLLIRQMREVDEAFFGLLLLELRRRTVDLLMHLGLQPDQGADPKSMFLATEDEERRRDFFQKACAAVEDPQHLQAVILFHGHGWPVESKDPRKPDLAHYFDASPRQVRYWINKALDRMR